METLYYADFQSPVGVLWAAMSGKGLVRFSTHSTKEEFVMDILKRFNVDPIYSPKFFYNLNNQLKEYFQGKRQIFDIGLDIYGTDFQQKVWQAIYRIPYGRLNSYGRISNEIGKPKAYRAAANAVGDNPIGLIIPCHRVVKSDGGFGGFGGGLSIKRQLLMYEGIFETSEGTPEKGVDLRTKFYY